MQPEIQPPTTTVPTSGVAPSFRPHIPRRDRQPGSDLLEPGEQFITVVHKHPIGIIGYYLESFIGLIVVIGFGWFLVHSLSSSSAGLLIALTLFALTVLVFFLFVTTYVYRQCRLILTDRSLIQIIQRSLFIRKVSRLSLSNVEDVSAESRGILASMFGYGTLLIQTAGAMDNFEFPYCPNPTFYADQIIEARQHYALSLQEGNEVHPSDQAIRGLS